jgi:hypothetical protein
MSVHLTEQVILDTLRQVPPERWVDVMRFLDSLITAEARIPEQPPIRTGEDLAASELFGLWADRADITDSTTFARQLREQASHRRGRPDASGH